MRERVYVWNDEQKRMVPAWVDRGPAYARAAGTRGEIVVGVSDRERERANQRASRERAA